MLRLIYVPDEPKSFTDPDLKPGLKVIRKSDGAECLLVSYGETTWALLHDHALLCNPLVLKTGALSDSMVSWLNREFRRADGGPRLGVPKTIGEVPVGHSFFMLGLGLVTMLDFRRLSGNRACWLWRLNIAVAWTDNIPIGRYFGAIEIDQAILEA